MCISAIIAGAAGLGAAAISSSGQKKAANTIAEGADAATAEQRRQFDITQGNLQPFLNFGYGAMGPLAQLLNIQPTTAAGAFGSTPASGGAAGSPNWAAYLMENPDVAAGVPNTRGTIQHVINAGYDRNGDGAVQPEEFAEYHYNTHGQGEGRQLPAAQSYQTQPVNTGGAAYSADNGGQSSLQQLFATVPGAQEGFDKALEGVTQSAYATGRTGGGVIDDLFTTGLSYGTTLRQNEINNLLSAMGYGSNNAATLGQIGANTAANIGNTQMNAANARASSYANNPWATGLGVISGIASSGGFDGLGEWWKNRNGGQTKKGYV